MAKEARQRWQFKLHLKQKLTVFRRRKRVPWPPSLLSSPVAPPLGIFWSSGDCRETLFSFLPSCMSQGDAFTPDVLMSFCTFRARPFHYTIRDISPETACLWGLGENRVWIFIILRPRLFSPPPCSSFLMESHFSTPRSGEEEKNGSVFLPLPPLLLLPGKVEICPPK